MKIFTIKIDRKPPRNILVIAQARGEAQKPQRTGNKMKYKRNKNWKKEWE